MKKNFTRLLWTILSVFFISAQSQAQSGQALNFVPNQYATLPNNILAGITADFTIEAWVYWRGGGDFQKVISIGSSSSNFMDLSVSGKTPTDPTGPQQIIFTWALTGHPQRQVTSVFSMPVGIWTHIAVTVDNTDPLFPKA
jgi:arabinan endo-1,5-alpha-L-arabinosidase